MTETGEVAELASLSPAPWQRFTASTVSVRNCLFRPYVIAGKAVRYKGDYELPTR